MLRRFFASFFSFLFVNFAVFFVLIFGIHQTVFDSSFYKEDLSGFFREMLIAEVVKKTDAGDFSLTENEFRQILERSLSSEDVFFAMQEIYDDLKRAENKDGELKIDVSFAWLKLKNQLFAKNLADVLYQKLGSCGSEVDFSSTTMIDCIPGNFSKEDFAGVLERELDLKFFSQIPGNYSFALELSEDFNSNSADFFTSMILKLLWFFGLGSLLLLILVAVSIYRPFFVAVKWSLWAVLSASFLAIGLFFALGYLGEAYTQILISQTSYEFAKNLSDFMSILSNALKGNVLFFLVPIFVFAFLGIILIHFKFKDDDAVKIQV